jgi:hypothetical protein
MLFRLKSWLSGTHWSFSALTHTPGRLSAVWHDRHHRTLRKILLSCRTRLWRHNNTKVYNTFKEFLFYFLLLN